MNVEAVKEAAIATALAVLASSVSRIVQEKRARWENRRWWTKPWVARRLENRRDAQSLLFNELKFEDQEAFRSFVRMDYSTFFELLNLIIPRITRQDTVMRLSIPPKLRLAITLRFLATGESLRSLAYYFRVPASTLSGIIPDTCRALVSELKDEYMKPPTTELEWRQIAEEFHIRWNYPHCLDAIDGKHIEFRPLRTAGSFFYNYKGSHSIVLLAIVDDNYRFLIVDVGCNGRISDGGVYRRSAISQAIESGALNFPPEENLPGTVLSVPYHFVADDAFAEKPHLLKPFKSMPSKKERIFNYRLSRARRVVENAFGIMSNRFRVLLKKVELDVEKFELITMTCCIMHNSFIARMNNQYTNASSSQTEDFHSYSQLRPLPKLSVGRCSKSVKSAKENMKTYFNSVGKVDWQEEAILKFNF